MVGVVVGELVGGNRGLGYLLTFGEGQANTPMVFVSIVMLTVVGGIAYLAVILTERRVLHYLPARSIGGSLQMRVDKGKHQPVRCKDGAKEDCRGRFYGNGLSQRLS